MFFSGSRQFVAERNPELLAVLEHADRIQRAAPSLLWEFTAALPRLEKRWAAARAKRPKQAPAKATRPADRRATLARMTASAHAARSRAADQSPGWANACHESGHCVAALVYGLRVDSVTIMSARKGVAASSEIYTRDAAPEQIGILAYAGAAAESRAIGESVAMTGSDRDHVDASVRAVLGRRPDADAALRLRNSWRDGGKLLVSGPAVWAAITDLARELSVRKMLSGQQCRDIVSRHIELD